MKNVFILTKEGKAYSKEGHKYIAEYLKNTFPQFGETGNLNDYLFHQGVAYNNPDVLKKHLLSNIGTADTPGCWIVVSKHKEMSFLGGTSTNINNFIADAEAHPELDSWEIFMGELATLEE